MEIGHSHHEATMSDAEDYKRAAQALIDAARRTSNTLVRATLIGLARSATQRDERLEAKARPRSSDNPGRSHN